MVARILVVNTAFKDASPLFEAAGRIARMNGAHIIGLAFPDTTNVDEWADWAGDAVEVVHRTVCDGLTTLKAIKEHKADFVVLGSACHAGVDHAHTPAMTEEVVLNTTLPVLLLHEETGVRMPIACYPLRMLVTLDGSIVAENILPAATALITALSGNETGELHLVQVFHESEEPDARRETMLALHAQVRWYLDQIADHVRKQVPDHIVVSSQIEPAPNVTEALLGLLGIIPSTDVQSASRWDLVAMGVLGPTGHEPHDDSSIVNRVLHSSHLPFLVQCQRTTPEIPHPVPPNALTDA